MPRFRLRTLLLAVTFASIAFAFFAAGGHFGFCIYPNHNISIAIEINEFEILNAGWVSGDYYFLTVLGKTFCGYGPIPV